MLVRFFDKRGKQALIGAGVVLGAAAAFFAAQLIVALLMAAYIALTGDQRGTISPIGASTITVSVLIIMLAILVFVRRRRLTRQDFRRHYGAGGTIGWRQVLLPLPAFVVYLLFSMALVAIAAAIWPGFNPDEVQQLGFSRLDNALEYIVAFLVLVVMVPILEELLFRGFVHGELRRHQFPPWVVIVVVSLLFAILHGQTNVAVDVFALSIVLGVLREYTGTIWAGVVLHAIKNYIAFYLLFINPQLLTTMGLL